MLIVKRIKKLSRACLLIMILSVFSSGAGSAEDDGPRRLLDDRLPKRSRLIEALEKGEAAGEKLVNKIEIGKNVNQSAADELARESADYFYSPEMQQKIDQEFERLQAYTKPLYKDFEVLIEKGQKKAVPARLAPDERVYVLVSSSMPMQVLKNYAAQLDKAGDPNTGMLLRGFVGGATYLKPTLEFLMQLLSKDDDCDLPINQNCEIFEDLNFSVDPMIFRRYRVEMVPAIVFVRGVQRVDGHETSEGIEEDFKIGDYFVAYGDMGLDYMLEKINRQAKSKSLEKLIAGLREGFYNQDPAKKSN